MRRLLVGAVLAVGMVILTACSTNPVAQGDTFEQKSFALYGTYVIFQGKAAELHQDSATPVKVAEALSAADRVAHPLAEALVDGALTVQDIRETLEACRLPEPSVPPEKCKNTNEQQLAIALTNLSSLYFKAKPAILGIVAAVKGAK